jgi:ATP-binding cassette, subfamily B, bacterial
MRKPPLPGGPGGLAGALAMMIAMVWRAHRGAFCGMLALAVLAGLAPIASASLLRAILDNLAAGRGHGQVLTLALALGAAGAATAVLPGVNQYLSAQSGRAVQRDATSRLFTAVTRLSGLGTLENPAFQDTLRFAQQAGGTGPGQVLTGGISIVQSAITLTGFLIALVVLSPVLAVIVTASAVPAVLLQRGMARREASVMRGITHAQRRQIFFATLLSGLTAAKEIRLFGLGPFFHTRMLDELTEVQRANTQVDRRVLGVEATLTLISAAVAAGGLLWAVSAAAAGRLSIGDLSMLVAALATVGATLGNMISSAAFTYQALLMFESYREVVSAPPDLPTPDRPTPAGPLRRGIEIDDVWFRYGPDKPWVLRGVSCRIARGQAIALVGQNGAGKSTLVKLLCRFYDPVRGQIRWDGTDLRDMDPAELRDRLSAVFQDYMTYELSAAENIAVGDVGRSPAPDLLHAAARQAGIHDTLAALPKGYQTLLTRTYFDRADKENPETGVLLSGGQLQRVALARAYLRGGRDLMIMDEPSAGLDAEAEHDLHRQLSLHRRDKTTVLISHRLNTVRDADDIVVLSGGVIAEQGSHDDLMALSGTYAKLFTLQARGYANTGATHD